MEIPRIGKPRNPPKYPQSYNKKQAKSVQHRMASLSCVRAWQCFAASSLGIPGFEHSYRPNKLANMPAMQTATYKKISQDLSLFLQVCFSF
eukprot:4233261-Amphidinium_carterae.1